MHTILCRAGQNLEIGEGVTITVLEIAPGVIRLSIDAPNQTVTRLEPVPLPVGASELTLVHRGGLPHWPAGTGGNRK